MDDLHGNNVSSHMICNDQTDSLARLVYEIPVCSFVNTGRAGDSGPRMMTSFATKLHVDGPLRILCTRPGLQELDVALHSHGADLSLEIETGNELISGPILERTMRNIFDSAVRHPGIYLGVTHLA